MTDSEKNCIRPLDEKSDFSLLRIRFRAGIGAKGLNNALRPMLDDTTDDKFTDLQDQAGNIIVAALSDHVVRVARSVIGIPAQMISNLDERYDSNSTAQKIAKMFQLVSIKFSDIRSDISGHIDRMAGLLEQLLRMGTGLAESLAIGIMVEQV